MFAYSCLTRLIGNGNPAINDAYTYITSLQLPSVYHNPSCDGRARDAE